MIRPSLSWLLTPGTVQMLTAEVARSRDPDGFTALAALCQDDPANYSLSDRHVVRTASAIPVELAPSGWAATSCPSDVGGRWCNRRLTLEE